MCRHLSSLSRKFAEDELALGSKASLVTRIARTGLGTRLGKLKRRQLQQGYGLTSQGLSGEGGGGSNTKIVYLRSTSCSERAISYFTVKTRVIVLIDNIIHGQVNGFFSSLLARYSFFNTITSAYK